MVKALIRVVTVPRIPAIEHERIAGRRDERRIEANNIGDNGEIRNMVQVREHDRPDINIVRLHRRSMYHDGANDSSGVLAGVVSVPEARAMDLGTKAIGEGLARRNRALCDATHTICPPSPFLEHTVSMYGGALVWTGDVVVNVNFNPVTPISLDGRTRVLAVDHDRIFQYAVG